MIRNMVRRIGNEWVSAVADNTQKNEKGNDFQDLFNYDAN